MTEAATFQPRSANRKLAPQRQERFPGGWRRNTPIGPYVASTYTSIAKTCPDSCAFKDAGCYEQTGPTAKHSADRDESARGMTGLEVTRFEASLIDDRWRRGVPQDGARGGRDLRLHVGGDVSCAEGAALLAEAAMRWVRRGGGRVWTFTHRWREIPSHAWGPAISVLASTESEAEADEAHASGYAASIVVPEYPRGHRVFSWPRSRLRAVPCPVESGARVTCSSCRLCMDDVALRQQRLVIAFAAHGIDAARVRLAVIR